jgi:hypothetical protein
MATPAPQPNDAVKAAYENFVREYRSNRPAEQIFSDERLFSNATLTAFSRYMSSMMAYYKDHPQDAQENESNYKTVMYLVPILKNEEARRKSAMSKNPTFYLSSYVECYLPNFRRAVPA